MPIFGDFETVGEPLAVTEYRGHTVTVWRACKVGTGDDPTFVVKCFAPHRLQAKAGPTEEALDKDRGLEFLEGVKQLKKAHTEGGRCLCPIHAFGFADEGPWYVSDYYPRNTLKAWIARRGSVDGPALAQVVRCVAAAALSLKRSRGCSHGNLKAANIFLVGKPRPLRQTPLELADAYPAGGLPTSQMGEAANRDVKDLLGEVMEAQDLRALGELLLQLVEGRLVSSAYDYNYPIAPSAAWERLGREADRWRELCNRLLDPQLSLAKVNFESLAREFQPSSLAIHRTKILAGTGALLVLVVSVYVGLQMVGRARDQRAKANELKYIALLAESRSALEQNDFAAALAKSAAALELKPGAPEATALKTEADQKREAAYQGELTEARTALAAGRFDDAERTANRALQFKPGDAAAGDLMKDAQTRRNASLTQAQQDRNYQQATNAAQVALAQRDFETALSEADRALGYRANDPVAVKMKGEAETGQRLAREQADRTRYYAEAMTAGRLALNQRNFDKAKSEADRALTYQQNDTAAQELRGSAETGIRLAREQAERDRGYQQATNAAQLALGKNDFSTALTEANRALGFRTNDGAALQLKSTAEQGQRTTAELAERERKFKEAMAAGQLALNEKNYDRAKVEAEQALSFKPGDAGAEKLKQDAITGQRVAQDLVQQEQNFRQATNAAQAALTRKDFEVARTEAQRALSYRTNNPAALKLQEAAEAGLRAARDLAAREASYQLALEAARAALGRNDFPTTITEARRALTFRENDVTARNLITAAETKQQEVATKNRRDQNYQQALTAATNALNQAEAAFEKMSYDAALREVTNALSQCQTARANGDPVLVLQLESAIKQRQAVMLQENQDNKQFDDLVTGATAALQADSLAVAEERFAAAQKLIPATAVAGRSQEIKTARMARLGGLNQALGQTTERLKTRIAALMETAKYREAADLAKGAKGLAELAGKIQNEQPLWQKAEAQFAQGNYAFLDEPGLIAYAQKLPFKTLWAQGQAERVQLSALQKAREEKKWQPVRDGFAALAPGVQQKPSFQEINQWIAANDPSNLLQARLNTYRVLFSVRGYRDLDEFKNKTVTPLPKRQVDRNWLAQQLRAVETLEQQFRELGKLEGRAEDLAAVKTAISQWND